MSLAVEANADGLVGPTHSYVGLAAGNLASARNAGEVSNPRAAALEGLVKMARVAALGVPQFVLPPHERPDLVFLRALGLTGDDGRVLESAWTQTPELAAAACSASAMWAANAATVTASADSRDGRVHLTPANLLSNLHRSLEAPQTTRALRALLPDQTLFVVHEPLPAQARFADEGAANHVRLAAEVDDPGVDLLVWGRDGDAHWAGSLPARQTRQASESVARRHGAARPAFCQQSERAIEAGAFHNDVVCVGARTCLLYHEAAFTDARAMQARVRANAGSLFEPVFLEVSESALPLSDAISTYLFNSQLLQLPGESGLVILAPAEVLEHTRARVVVDSLVDSKGPIGRVEFVDVRQSMRNGGGPACLRLRLPLTEGELAAVNPGQRFTPGLHGSLRAWVERHYRDRLAPADLRDSTLVEEGRAALDQLTRLLDLGSGFYPFQRDGLDLRGISQTA